MSLYSCDFTSRENKTRDIWSTDRVCTPKTRVMTRHRDLWIPQKRRSKSDGWERTAWRDASALFDGTNERDRTTNASETRGGARRRYEENNFFHSCADVYGATDEGYVRIHRTNRTASDKKRKRVRTEACWTRTWIHSRSILTFIDGVEWRAL